MPKRDELVGLLAVAKEALVLSSEKDVARRKQISEMLGMYSETPGHLGRNVQGGVVLSWERIFFELGKLMQRQRNLQYVEDIEEFKLTTQENTIELRELWNEIASQKKHHA